MSNQTVDSGDKFVRRACSGVASRTGVARDQLIFIIICSVSLVVAAITLVHFVTGGYSRGPVRNAWQCLNCNYEFSKKVPGFSSIECPKCGGQAVRVVYRKCPKCGAEVLFYRLRPSPQAQDQRAADQPAVSPMMVQAMEVQYKIKQPDGSLGWTGWMPAGSGEAVQARNAIRCSKCNASLVPILPR